MATVNRCILRRLRRAFSSSSAPIPRNNHQQTHEFLEVNSFIGSWEAPKNPKEAEKKLAQLRRDYAKQVKETRKGYIEEMELLRLEKLRKDEARKEALRLANEERQKLKAEAAKVRAEERKVAEEELRHTLLKERAEKLEYWRMTEQARKKKKIEEKEVICQKSSLWIDEKDLEKKILEAMPNVEPL